MSYSPMDLDSSLDDLIKKRRQKQPKNSPNKKQQQQQQQQPKSVKNIKKQPSRSNIPIQSNKAKITKPSAAGINARLSTTTTTTTNTAPVSGPLFTAKNRPTNTTKQKSLKKADPSQIIITKAIPTNTKSPAVKRTEVKSVLTGRLGTQLQNTPDNHTASIAASPRYYPSQPPKTIEPMHMDLVPDTRYSDRVGDFSIRGRSNTVNIRPPLSIKGESGPTTVLVTGLDPGANSEDVEIALEEFGNILHCEVLRDRMGRSFGEAEVEFSSKSAALDCIARLDNQMADGKFLRVILREPKPKQSFAAKQIRSVISSSYPSSGKMYADQIAPRYDITRQ